MRKSMLWVSLLCVGVVGCEERSSTGGGPQGKTRPAVVWKSDAEVNQFLLEFVRGHGIAARVDGDWVEVEGSPVKLNGDVGDVDESRKDFVTVQLEMRLMLGDGRVVTQPVVGWGTNRKEAVGHAQASFLLGTLHAWLAAFIDPADEHVEREERVIGGRKRLVTYGSVVTKAVGGEGRPEDGGEWRRQLMAEIEGMGLPAGMHWVDVYNGFVGDQQEMEIGFDGKRWDEMERRMRGAKWPRGGTMTSVRLFLVIQEVDDPTRPKTRPTTVPTTRHVN